MRCIIFQLTVFATIAVLLDAGRAAAEEAATFASPPPTSAVAQLLGDVLILRQSHIQFTTVQKQRAVQVDGQPKYETYEVSMPVNITSERAVGRNDYRILDMQGKQVDSAIAAQRLATEAPVLVSEHAAKVDPIFLEIYKPDTLIVYVRHTAPAYGYQPAPALHQPPPAIPGRIIVSGEAVPPSKPLPMSP